MLAVRNLHNLIPKKKGITESNITGDGTGYSLIVKKNYESYRQKKDMAKVSDDDNDRQQRKKAQEKALCLHVCHNGLQVNDVHLKVQA